MDRYYKINELLEKFENGKERYKKDPLFNQTIQMLADDVDPYIIISDLINVCNNTQKGMIDLMRRY